MMRHAARAIVEWEGEMLLTRNQTNGEEGKARNRQKPVALDT